MFSPHNKRGGSPGKEYSIATIDTILNTALKNMKRPCTRIRQRHHLLSTVNHEAISRDQNITNTDIVDIKVLEAIIPAKKKTVTRVLTDTAIALGDLQVLKPFSPTEERRATLRAVSR